jgi:predicted metal-dependent phosphoesterase TrpH
MVGARECYNEPEEVYQTAKERGMDFVPITDHDAIEAALILNDKYPDVIVGEENQVKASNSGDYIHIITLGINENIHNDLKDLKKIGLKETIKYLKEKNILHFTSHIAHSASHNQLTLKFIDNVIKHTDILEIYNAEILPEENAVAEFLAKIYNKKKVAGSDAHVLDTVGKVFTMSQDHVETKQEFLECIKHGKCDIHKGNVSPSLSRLAIESLIYIKNVYKEAIFSPRQRMESSFQRQLLDYLTLTIIALPAATGIPSWLISKNYRKNQRRNILSLQEEIRQYIIESKSSKELQEKFDRLTGGQ